MTQGFRQILAGAMLLSAAAAANAAIELSLLPVSQSAAELSVGVAISGLSDGAAPALGAYDFDVLFDTAHLAYVSADFGDAGLGDQLDAFALGVNPQSAALAEAGKLNVFELSLDDPADLNAWQADNFTLAVLHFNILQTGDTTLSLAVNALGDADGDALAASTTPLTVTAVPVPPAFALMAAGLGLLVKPRRSA
ncbi:MULTISPECIES: hypothetical protein [Methylomonas]|nr:hypothetical protein [Methylomonas koyamae]